MTTSLEPWSSPTTRFWAKWIGSERPYSVESSAELLRKWRALVERTDLDIVNRRRLALILEDEAIAIRDIGARGLAVAFELAMLEEFDTWYAPFLPPGTAKPSPTPGGSGAVLKLHFPAIVTHVQNG